MKLVFLPANQAWAFFFGSSMERLPGQPMFYRKKSEAMQAAERAGLRVTPDGTVELKAV